MLATFVAMLAPATRRIGAVALMPWVGLLGVELGLGLGAPPASRTASTRRRGDRHAGRAGPLAIRRAALLVLGAGAGYVGDRLRDHERVLRGDRARRAR